MNMECNVQNKTVSKRACSTTQQHGNRKECELCYYNNSRDKILGLLYYSGGSGKIAGRSFESVRKMIHSGDKTNEILERLKNLVSVGYIEKYKSRNKIMYIITEKGINYYESKWK